MSFKKIKTIEQAFESRGIASIPAADSFPVIDRLKNYTAKNYQLIVAVEAVNEGWVPDYSDDNQYKYEIWFEVKIKKNKKGEVTGSGLALRNVDDWRTGTDAGARLAFESREKANHFWKYFQPLLEDLFLIR